MWWVKRANKSIYTCSDSRKAREICWTMAILQTTECGLPCKPPCPLSGLHTSCFSFAFPCPHTYWARLHHLLSHTVLPAVLPPALSTFISCSLPPCSPLICASFHPCPLTQALPALLSTFSLLFILTHTLSSSIRPLPYHFPIWGSPASPSTITPSVPISFSLHPLSSIPTLPVSALVFTFSGDPRSTHLCVDAEAICLPLFYSIINFWFQSFSLINCNTKAKKKEVQINSNRTPWWDVGFCGWFLSLVPIRLAHPWRPEHRSQCCQAVLKTKALDISNCGHCLLFNDKTMPLAGSKESKRYNLIICKHLYGEWLAL